jgi:hypothetical protein
MISDLDIYQAAKFLVDRQGEGAPDHAAGRAVELLEAGDRKAPWSGARLAARFSI